MTTNVCPLTERAIELRTLGDRVSPTSNALRIAAPHTFIQESGYCRSYGASIQNERAESRN